MSRETSRRLVAWALAILVCLPATAAGQEEKREYQVSPGGKISFDLDAGGMVHVTGWERETAQVAYQQRGRGSEQVVKIKQTGQDLRVMAWASDDEDDSRDIMFEVMVPRRFDIALDTMGGNLVLIGLEGTFTGRTMGGSLALRDVRGSVDLTTMGGSIEVVNADLDGSLSTMGGPVLLQDVVGDVNATSMGGDVRYSNVRSRDGKLRAPQGLSGEDGGVSTVLISTMGGDIDVDEAPAGAKVRTMGGDIRVEKAAGFVDALTMGGDIAITVSDGWAHATTMAGEVTVKVEGGLGDGDEGVRLTSNSGDVTLTLPKGLSLDLDLTVAYTRNSSQDYRITSDVPLQEERSKHWDYGNGSPRKRIHATGKTGDGRYPVTIKTINGNIRLRIAG